MTGTSIPKAGPSGHDTGWAFRNCWEAAEVAVMLARNGYITGQTINVNGGWYMS